MGSSGEGSEHDAAAARAREVVRARIAVTLAFFLLGSGAGIWAVHIPLVAERLHIDASMLGLAFLTMAAGTLVATPLMAHALAHYGSRQPMSVTLVGYSLATPLLTIAWSVRSLFVLVFFFGICTSALDVAMNTQAYLVETARNRPTMSSFHGFYSIGGLTGSMLGAGVIALGWGGNARGAALLMTGLLGVALSSAAHLLADERQVNLGPRFVMPTRAVVGLGLLMYLGFAVEGSVQSWSALYLSSVKHAGDALGAIGFAAFSFAMAAFRLVGDGIVARVGAKKTVIAGGVLIALGLGVAVLSPLPLVGALSFALVGVGNANIVPVVFGAAARCPGMAPSAGVAAVATIGYSGIIITPPLLGFVARDFGLSIALGLVACCGMAIAMLTNAVMNGPRRDGSGEGPSDRATLQTGDEKP